RGGENDSQYPFVFQFGNQRSKSVQGMVDILTSETKNQAGHWGISDFSQRAQREALARSALLNSNSAQLMGRGCQQDCGVFASNLGKAYLSESRSGFPA